MKLKRIADVVGVSLEWLVTGRHPPPRRIAIDDELSKLPPGIRAIMEELVLRFTEQLQSIGAAELPSMDDTGRFRAVDPTRKSDERK